MLATLMTFFMVGSAIALIIKQLVSRGKSSLHNAFLKLPTYGSQPECGPGNDFDCYPQ